MPLIVASPPRPVLSPRGPLPAARPRIFVALFVVIELEDELLPELLGSACFTRLPFLEAIPLVEVREVVVWAKAWSPPSVPGRSFEAVLLFLLVLLVPSVFCDAVAVRDRFRFPSRARWHSACASREPDL